MWLKPTLMKTWGTFVDNLLDFSGACLGVGAIWSLRGPGQQDSPTPILLTTPEWSPAPALVINLQYLPSGSCPWYLHKQWGACCWGSTCFLTCPWDGPARLVLQTFLSAWHFPGQTEKALFPLEDLTVTGRGVEGAADSGREGVSVGFHL